ncbi:hypothetical protein [Nocardia sp. NPDC057440]|uniref:hypothetical protein n=1 Tax=Nocardia sp. NPDC057440 TaxID=3346134 RepID=UPI003670D599
MLAELWDTLAETAQTLPPDWDRSYIATRRLILAELTTTAWSIAGRAWYGPSAMVAARA